MDTLARLTRYCMNPRPILCGSLNTNQLAIAVGRGGSIQPSPWRWALTLLLERTGRFMFLLSKEKDTVPYIQPAAQIRKNSGVITGPQCKVQALRTESANHSYWTRDTRILDVLGESKPHDCTLPSYLRQSQYQGHTMTHSYREHYNSVAKDIAISSSTGIVDDISGLVR
jgi:hypothetical protein